MTFDVAVVGSCNVDIVARGDSLPGPGETVISRTLLRTAGGKGANQAAAAARAGARCAMVGAVGDDADAALVLGSLGAAGVDTSPLRRVPGPTGTALIVVGGAGENQIAVVPGANGALRGLLDAERAVVEGSRVVLLQLEIPIEANQAAAAAGHAAGALVILNAAPAIPLSQSLLDCVDLVVVNRSEAAALGGPDALLERVRTVVMTLGAEGAVYRSRAEAAVEVPAPHVAAIDSTGAGDTFAGYLAAALALGSSAPEAMRLAVAAASIAVQRQGAAASIPSRAEVEAAL